MPSSQNFHEEVLSLVDKRSSTKLDVFLWQSAGHMSALTDTTDHQSLPSQFLIGLLYSADAAIPVVGHVSCRRKLITYADFAVQDFLADRFGDLLKEVLSTLYMRCLYYIRL